MSDDEKKQHLEGFGWLIEVNDIGSGWVRVTMTHDTAGMLSCIRENETRCFDSLWPSAYWMHSTDRMVP